MYLHIHSVSLFSFLHVCIFLGCLSFHVRRHFCAFLTFAFWMQSSPDAMSILYKILLVSCLALVIEHYQTIVYQWLNSNVFVRVLLGVLLALWHLFVVPGLDFLTISSALIFACLLSTLLIRYDMICPVKHAFISIIHVQGLTS